MNFRSPVHFCRRIATRPGRKDEGHGGRRLGSRQGGFMLIDCLVYISLVGLILGLAFAAFFRTLEQTTHLERNTTDIVRALQAGERWREDVRATTRGAVLVPGADEFILRLPRPQGSVAYVVRVRDGTIFREEQPGNHREQLLSNVKQSEFHHERRSQVAGWRWELELQGQRATRVRPLFTFLALAQAEPETKP